MKISFKKLLVTAFTLIIFTGCQQKDSSNLNNVNSEKLPDQEGWNSTITATTNGRITARINYGYMKKFNKKKLVFFEDGITIDFFNEEGQHTSKLTSQKGKLDEKTNNVEAYENVVLVSDSGYTLQTEKLWWDNTIEKVISDQFVTITTIENDTLHGVGFESDRTLVNWTINEVRGKTAKNFDLNFTKEKPLSGDAAKKEETQITNEKGQVIATIKYSTKQSNDEKKELCFNEGIIVDFFDDAGQHITKLTADEGKLKTTNNIEAYGHVAVVSDSGLTLKTEQLKWDNANKKFISDQFVTITTAELVKFTGIGFESDKTLLNWMIKEVSADTTENSALQNKITK